MASSRSPGLADRRTPRRWVRTCFSLGVLSTALGAGCLATALAAPPDTPAAQPASPEHNVGRVVLRTLVTPDLLAAERFYGGLFNWTFKDRPDHAGNPGGGEQSAQAFLGTDPVAILFQRPLSGDAHRRPAWMTFFSVADVATAEKTVVSDGARLLAQPKALADVGEDAVFADPQGAVFAVLATSSGDPPDILAEPGGWIWSSLMTTDPDTDAAFYQKVFGDEVYDVSTDEREEQLILAAGGFARASVNPIPARRPDAHPYWLNYVRVDDASAAAAKAAQLGGKILVDARPDRQGGKIAVVADPAGAALGLMEWQDADESDSGDPSAVGSSGHASQ